MYRRHKGVTAAVVVALCSVVLVSAILTDANARSRVRHEKAAVASAHAHLAVLRQQLARVQTLQSVTATTRDNLQASIQLTDGQLWDTTLALNGAKTAAFLQGVDIKILETCIGGVQRALGAIRANDNAQATKDISAVSSECTQLEGRGSSGLVYPYNFPDPDLLLVGSTYFAYSTNSVSGNVQVLESTNLTQWNAVGDALPHLPSWAGALYTWHPSVAFIGGKYDLYYAVDPKGSTSECISVATSSTPAGPFIDASSAPLKCQPSLGGSIDPDAFVGTDGSVYLLWKSGRAGTALLWAQQLDPSGTAFAPGSSAVTILKPDQSWEAGNIEAPDLVAENGRYLLFYSGNDWASANYAVGVASCSGPLGPCSDLTTSPILGSGDGVSGPGADSVFADTSGNFWIAFDGWNPGAVGGSNNRALYIRSLNLSGVPTVGGPP